MEYVQPGSLKNFCASADDLDERLVQKFTRQMLCGLAYLHSQRVVHRDIKADNVLVHKDHIVKLADFGLSKTLELSVVNHSMMGHPFWTAPELDIWSLGCTVIEMFSGKRPWHGFESANVVCRGLS